MACLHPPRPPALWLLGAFKQEETLADEMEEEGEIQAFLPSFLPQLGALSLAAGASLSHFPLCLVPASITLPPPRPFSHRGGLLASGCFMLFFVP